MTRKATATFSDHTTAVASNGPTLTPLSDWNSQKMRDRIESMKPRPTGIACPECQHELLDAEPHLLYTTEPPKKRVQCSNCKWKGLRFA